MARPIKEFVDAWRALSAFSSPNGWQTVPVAPAGSCLLRAGRHFPGNEEALLVRFIAASIPPAANLPRGQGFSVDRVDEANSVRGWLALSRQLSGSVDLFAMMVADVAGAMDANAALDEEQLLRIFLARVRAWQDFMKAGSHALGPEAETGLIGELTFLDTMIGAGVDPTSAIESWVGPLDAPQDFAIGGGAIEVKSTLAASGFRAKIGSLDQLDDAVRTPLFFVAVRLRESASGKTLPESVESMKSVMAHDPSAVNVLANRLLAAGYIDAHADRYIRRFALSNLRVLEVNASFPRITPAAAPDGVLQAVYEIDVDRAPGKNLSPIDALRRLGAL